MTIKKPTKTSEPKSRCKPASYCEEEIIADWRVLAHRHANDAQGERLQRLADQLQQIVWRRGNFRIEPPRTVRLSFLANDQPPRILINRKTKKND